MADTIEEWLAEGVAKRWCSEPRCASHDTLWTDDELAENGDGEYLLDSCMPAVRLLPDELVAEGWRPDGEAPKETSRFRSV